ncbi:hypothetical protein QTH91_03340 [Variovorax dokdonensis]|uniref:Histidine kinase n=1 Tax=Variovorax dokdonensis TaxID=344883 RepID=A0ABT7N6D2_9BURK|nr:hypothetical protein [Variovorax dokdonensis]MDM0043504.1 hypothetical protein [Variovorax dokdonensis]
MMKASPGARSWIAAGVRHELMSRVLPALRHDMVAPVSVVRMALLTLRRQLAASSIDAQACLDRVALLDDQFGELTQRVRALRDWELAPTGESITRSALVDQCVSLLRPAFDLHGVQLQVDADIESEVDGQSLPRGGALRYLLLCAMCYLHDLEQGRRRIHITAPEDGALLLVCEPRDDGLDGPDGAVNPAPRQLAIDAVALQSLADDLGFDVAHDDAGKVRLRLVQD